VAELDDELYDLILKLSEEGNVLYYRDEHEGALKKYKEALALVPEPQEDWEAALWCLVAIGDCLFLLGRFQEAHHYLTRSMHCPDALGNPFIHLRLGQVQYELGNVERAKDELGRAYMGGGPEQFSDEDPKYYAFLRQFMKGL
jgi:tetratricopeptide (TPR) repeat protein